MIPAHETPLRVRYAETDQMGVVYYANFFVWFEIGRVELMRHLGVEYKQMEERDDCFIVVAECACRYLRPARYDDLLRVHTRVAEVRSRAIRFEYEIFDDARKTRLATGHTVHVICDRRGAPKSLPEQYRQLLRAPRSTTTAARHHP